MVYIGDGGGEQSYPALLEAALRILGGLQLRGLKAGDRVLFRLGEPRAFVESMWACFLGAIVPVVAPGAGGSVNDGPSNPSSCRYGLPDGPSIVSRPVRVSRQRGLPGDPAPGVCLDYEGLIQSTTNGEPVPVDRDDVAVEQLTSGTTGTRRRIPLTHANLLAAVSGGATLDIFSGPASLCWTSLDHVSSLVWHLREVQLGRRQVFGCAATVSARPLTWIDWLDQYRVAVSRAPNFAFARVVRELQGGSSRPWDLSCVRTIVNGAEPVGPETCRRFVELLRSCRLGTKTIFAGYGLTETCGGAVYSQVPCASSDGVHVIDRASLGVRAPARPVGRDHPRAALFADLGRPCPGVELRVVDEADHVLDERVMGHVQIRGASVVLPRHLGDGDRETFAGDGWLRTGDIGFVADGSLVLAGRHKDLIVVRGRNVSLHDIEAAAKSVPGVDPMYVAACRARDIEHDTESAVVFFATMRGHAESASTVASGVRRAIAAGFGFVPTAIVEMSAGEFPPATGAKLQRAALQQRVDRGEFRAAESVPARARASLPASISSRRPERRAGTTEERIREAFTERLGAESVAPDDDFFAMGGDSLAAATILEHLARTLDVRLPPDIFFTCPTPRSLAAAVVANRVAGAPADSPSVVPLSAEGEGSPVFFVHGVTPRPWMFRLLTAALDLNRPVYGTRAPDLDWERDVLTIEEMAVHYATEIRRVQPRGPYSLMGYSFGGTLAFEIARRLTRDGQRVAHLVLLDTSAPGLSVRWLRRAAAYAFIDTVRALSWLGLLRHGTVRHLPFRTPLGKFTTLLGRVRLSFGMGPMTVDELRTVLNLAFARYGHRRTRAMPFEVLCATIADELRRALTERQWKSVVRRAGSEAPTSVVKGQKLTVKNFRLGHRYRPRSLYDGTVTIYARRGNSEVNPWQRYTSQPVDMRRVAIDVRPGRDAHREFVARHNTHTYVRDLRRFLESDGYA